MVLDDVTQGFAKPCVMDLKIGTRTWGKGIPAAKVTIGLPCLCVLIQLFSM